MNGGRQGHGGQLFGLVGQVGQGPGDGPADPDDQKQAEKGAGQPEGGEGNGLPFVLGRPRL